MNNQVEVLVTVEEYIYELKKGITNVVQYIQDGQEQSAFKLIGQIADGIEWLLQAIKLTKDYHQGKVSDNNINEKLSEIVEALENEDYVLVSDLFNYEILEVLDIIQKEINNIVRL
jgi:hypothetical protein